MQEQLLLDSDYNSRDNVLELQHFNYNNKNDDFSLEYGGSNLNEEGDDTQLLLRGALESCGTDIMP